METLPAQFNQAVSNVTINEEKRTRAIEAHTEVRTLLESDEVLTSWGIDTFLIGSYGRQTARYPGKDVDIFLRLVNLTVDADPADVYRRVADVLVTRYGLADAGGRVTLQARSVKVDFAPPTGRGELGFSVDAVPAVPKGQHWAIPNRNRDSWTERADRWILTDPIEFHSLTNTVANNGPSVNSDNAYRQIVRLLRQIRHTHLGEAKPGGLYVEIAAYYAWRDGLVRGASWAELLTASLRQVAFIFERSAFGEGLKDPVLQTPLKPALDAAVWRQAASKFAELATKAERALGADKCQSAKAWREVLGTNDRGQVFPLPSGCDSEGRVVPAVSAIRSTGPTQARGFALQLRG
jgi:hypothetical protein